ncbi:phage tail protein [Roseibium sediminis]|uniref:phage tail protein n=1 Tax=Roseibium sediminis TaxID=1775174 RepID=UPI00123E220A|nr:phage tail protein [Roseibium sediminis]
MIHTLLPDNYAPTEVAVELAGASEDRLMPGVDRIPGWKLTSRSASLIPFLIYEFGLEALVPYIQDQYFLIDAGRQWARVRGTHKAIDDGLGFVGYAAGIEEPPERRSTWWKVQLHLDRLRDSEEDLERIDGIVGLSLPTRSKLRRVYHGYNIPAVETGYTRLGSCRLAGDSGVRVRGLRPKWSFGRTHDFSMQLVQADYEALGIWIPEVSSQKWIDMDFPWADANFRWADDAEIARRVSLGQSLEQSSVWLKFTDTTGAVIGYRNATCRAVSAALDGFDVSGNRYARDRENPTHVLAFGRTDFGEGYGATAAQVSLLFGPDLTDPSRPGALWLGPSGLSGGVEIAAQPLDLEFGETVRDHVQILMRL